MNIEIYGIEGCGYCEKAKNLFERKGFPFTYTDFNTLSDDEKYVIKHTKAKSIATTYPIIFINDVYVGGFSDVNNIIG